MGQLSHLRVKINTYIHNRKFQNLNRNIFLDSCIYHELMRDADFLFWICLFHEWLGAAVASVSSEIECLCKTVLQYHYSKCLVLCGGGKISPRATFQCSSITSLGNMLISESDLSVIS